MNDQESCRARFVMMTFVMREDDVEVFARYPSAAPSLRGNYHRKKDTTLIKAVSQSGECTGNHRVLNGKHDKRIFRFHKI